MADSLSRSEVESLLSALDPKQTAAESGESREVRSNSFSHEPSTRKSSSLARSAVLFCESVRKRIEMTWESLLREPVRLKRHMPRTLAFSELLDQHQTSHLGFLLESNEDRADLVLLIERGLVEPMISRLLGNSGRTRDPQEFSQLETRLLKRLMGETFREPLPECEWSMSALERFDFSAERSARTSRTSWWCESWELKTDAMRGKLLFAGEWDFVSRRDSAPNSRFDSRLTEPRLEIVAELDSISLKEDQVRSLQPGDTLTVGTESGEEVRIQVSGETRWTGCPGIHEGRKAVQIERIFDSND